MQRKKPLPAQQARFEEYATKQSMLLLYAVRCSKFPGKTSVGARLGIGADVCETQLKRAAASGHLEPKVYGRVRIIYQLTAMGAALLDAYLRQLGKLPELHPEPKKQAAIGKKLAQPDGDAEPKPNVAPPRTYCNASAGGSYSPAWERQNYRAGAFDHLRFKSKLGVV